MRVANASIPLLLSGKAYRLPTLGALAEPLAATEIGHDSSRVVFLPTAAGERSRAWAPGESDCRAVAALPPGRRLLVACDDRHDRAPGLRLLELRDGGVLTAAIWGEPGETVVAWSADGSTVWTASAPTPSAAARLIATDAAGVRRSVHTAPPGFTIAAYSPDSDRALFHRVLHSEAHEVVLRDGRSATSRLLLPSDADGRFTSLAFLARGDAVLLLADDGTDTARIERLDPVSGRRARWAEFDCPPVGVTVHADDGATVLLDCDGRREVRRLDPSGREVPLPAVAAGTRIVDWRPMIDGDRLALVTAGEQWPEEIGISVANTGYHPLTYGLAGRLRPQALPAPRPWPWNSGRVDLPAETWTSTATEADAVVVWIGGVDGPPDLGVHRPLLATLAAHGLTSVVLHGRGDESPSRRARRAADSDPATAAWDDLRAAHAATASLAPAAAPRLLVAAGAWWGAAALALATSSDDPFDGTFALYPAPDPLSESVATQSHRLQQVARPDEPEDPALARRREGWRLPVERLRHSVVVALDPRSDGHGPLRDRIALAAASGAPVELLEAHRRFSGERLPGALERELVRRLLAAAGDATH